MSLLNENFENTTTIIGTKENGTLRWIGTGFFVTTKNKKGPGKYVYLVTNKHVIKNLNAIVIRVHLKNDQIVPLDVLLNQNGTQLYLGHPHDNIDIAVIQLSGQYIEKDLKNIKAFDLDNNSYNAKSYLAEGGFEGSPVFMLGFPMGIIDEYSTTPICRMGHIARFKINDIINTHNFLLDIQNFPGNSGSPIISCPENIGINGTKMIGEARLIGIVHGYIPYKESLYNAQTNEIVEIRSENSGLAVAHPVDFIKETIELDLQNKNL